MHEKSGRPRTRGNGSADAPLLHAVLEGLDAALVVCDCDGRLVHVNAVARELWAPPEGFAPGCTAREIRWFADAGDELASDPLSGALAGEGPVRCRRPLASDQARTVLVEAGPVHDRSGDLLGAMMKVALSEEESETDAQLYGFASDLMMLGEVSRLLAEISDPDEAAGMICTVALGATGAVAMLLWRLVDGELALGQYEAALSIGETASISDPTHPGAARALASGSTTIEQLGLADDGMTLLDATASAEAGAEAAAITAWHEPLVSGGHVIGVLTIMFPGVIDDPSRPAALISSLAQHSAAALERADLLRQLAAAARTDALTGVANRRVWVDRLDQELLRADRGQRALSLVIIDIDDFKRFNDTYGHAEGDRLLQEAAAAWSRRLRRTDLLARIGGEEFGVLLPDCPAEHLAIVAESLRAAMPEGQTCSVGGVTFDGAASAAALYEAADAALYRAKRGGRNRVEIGVLPGAVP